MEKNRTNPGMHRWFVPETGLEFDLDSAHIMIGEIFAIFFMQHWGLVVVNIALLLICFCTTGCALKKLKKEINRSLESTVIVGRIYGKYSGKWPIIVAGCSADRKKKIDTYPFV